MSHCRAIIFPLAFESVHRWKGEGNDEAGGGRRVVRSSYTLLLLLLYIIVTIRAVSIHPWLSSYIVGLCIY